MKDAARTLERRASNVFVPPAILARGVKKVCHIPLENTFFMKIIDEISQGIISKARAIIPNLH